MLSGRKGDPTLFLAVLAEKPGVPVAKVRGPDVCHHMVFVGREAERSARMEPDHLPFPWTAGPVVPSQLGERRARLPDEYAIAETENAADAVGRKKRTFWTIGDGSPVNSRRSASNGCARKTPSNEQEISRLAGSKRGRVLDSGVGLQ